MLEELSSLAQAKLDQVFDTGDAQVLLEKVHEVGGAVAADSGQLVDGQLLLVVLTDIVDDGADLFFLAVALRRQLLGDHIAVSKEQVEELVELGLELEFIVFLLVIAGLHGVQQAGPDLLVARIVWLDDMDEVQLAIVEGLEVVEAGLVHGRIAHEVQVEIDGVHIVELVLDGMDGVEGIGPDQDNVPLLAVKVVVVDMKLGAAFVDIDHLDVGMPVVEDVRMAVFGDGPGQRVGSALVFVDGVFVELP